MSHKPKCIIVTGRPGAGKTTLSKELSRLLCMPIISRDEIKEGYVNTFGIKHDQLPSNTNGIATETFFEVAEQLLKCKVSIIVEAAFPHKIWEYKMNTWKEISKIKIIICTIDDKIAANRHLQRGLNDPNRVFYHGDKRVSYYQETGIISPPDNYDIPKFDVPTISVITLDDYSPKLEELKEMLNS